MLIHAMEKWPYVVTIDLWPFALRMAANIHNATPGPSGLSPKEIFTQQKARPGRLLDFHMFGCPVFVLDRAYVPAGHHLSLGVMWQYGDERSVASTRTMSVPYGVCCSSA
jgi:hypothetical protein